MKLAIAIAALFLATTTTLPAVAAPPMGDTSSTPVETVQYRQTPRHPLHTYRYRNGYNAYAAQPGTARSAEPRSHDVLPGWPCADRTESSAYSAYPSWEICN
ncbi:MAG: hypothetical protein GEU95_09510 [Rhizobiales bacterium]|nr:hypothetical protein [Hyphomicrobiales bacterium]